MTAMKIGDELFYVKTKLKESTIHGVGLFADQDIKKNANVYSSNNRLDLRVSESEFSLLSDDEKSTIKHYGYFDNKNKVWSLLFDNMRFCNHSVEGNIALHGDKVVAIRDIKNGEELTQDYGEFELLREDLKV